MTDEIARELEVDRRWIFELVCRIRAAVFRDCDAIDLSGLRLPVSPLEAVVFRGLIADFAYSRLTGTSIAVPGEPGVLCPWSRDWRNELTTRGDAFSWRPST